MVESADPGFFQLQTAPFDGIGFRQSFDDFDDFGASRDTLFLELRESVVGRRTSLVRILENSILAAAGRRALGMSIARTATTWLPPGRRRYSGSVAQSAQYFSDHVAD